MSDKTADKDLAKPEKSALSKWGWRLFKIALFLGVFLFIILTVLSRLGGNGEILKSSIEEILSESTPYEVSVGHLTAMHFFPNIIMDIQDIRFHVSLKPDEAPEGEEENSDEDPFDAIKGETVITIEDAKLVLGFFDAMFRPGRIKDVQIRNVRMKEGTVFPQAAVVESFLIDEYEKEKFALDLLGHIGGMPVHAKMDLESKGEGYSRVFIFGDRRDVKVTISDIRMDAEFVDTFGDGFQLENITLKNKDTQVARGNLSFDPSGNDAMGLKGQIRVEPNKSHLDPDILIDWGDDLLSISGDIRGEELALDDLKGDGPFIRTIDKVAAMFGDGKKGKPLDLSGIDLDIDLDFASVRQGALLMGSVKAPLTIKEAKLEAQPLSGKIFKGDLSGGFTIDTSKKPATLTQKVIIKNLDYGFIQKQFQENAEIDGKANLSVNLSSSGSSMDALIDGLSGTAHFVGGEAKMRSGLLNVWGSGLLSALMPKIDNESDLLVNCVVVNMDIDKLKATSDAVFVDTKRVTLRGKGSYDIKNDKMDMVLEPKNKDISIGDTSAAVNVIGPLDDLSVSPNVLDLGKRVGGLLLGAVNPAFYAISIADLGLRDNHPCKEFVIEKEALPPPENDDQPKDKEGSTTPSESEAPKTLND